MKQNHGFRQYAIAKVGLCLISGLSWWPSYRSPVHVVEIRAMSSFIRVVHFEFPLYGLINRLK